MLGGGVSPLKIFITKHPGLLGLSLEDSFPNALCSCSWWLRDFVLEHIILFLAVITQGKVLGTC